MKAAALIVECANGKMHSVPSKSLEPLREIAKKARDIGEIEINKKMVPIVGGAILASWRNGPDMKFRVRANVAPVL